MILMKGKLIVKRSRQLLMKLELSEVSKMLAKLIAGVQICRAVLLVYKAMFLATSLKIETLTLIMSAKSLLKITKSMKKIRKLYRRQARLAA